MAVFIMAIVHIVSSYAQSVLPISGEVLDGKNREPLIGVTVVEKGTKNGVITDIDGKFSMRVPVGTILKITYMGYRSSEVIIRDNKPQYYWMKRISSWTNWWSLVMVFRKRVILRVPYLPCREKS